MEAGSWRTINTLPFTETRGKKRDGGGEGSIVHSTTTSALRSSAEAGECDSCLAKLALTLIQGTVDNVTTLTINDWNDSWTPCL